MSVVACLLPHTPRQLLTGQSLNTHDQHAVDVPLVSMPSLSTHEEAQTLLCKERRTAPSASLSPSQRILLIFLSRRKCIAPALLPQLTADPHEAS